MKWADKIFTSEWQIGPHFCWTLYVRFKWSAAGGSILFLFFSSKNRFYILAVFNWLQTNVQNNQNLILKSIIIIKVHWTNIRKFMTNAYRNVHFGLFKLSSKLYKSNLFSPKIWSHPKLESIKFNAFDPCYTSIFEMQIIFGNQNTQAYILHWKYFDFAPLYLVLVMVFQLLL